MEHGIEWIEWRQTDWRAAGGRAGRTYKLTSCLGKWANGSRQLTDWRPAATPRRSLRTSMDFYLALNLSWKRIFNWQVALNCTQGRVQGENCILWAYLCLSLRVVVTFGFLKYDWCHLEDLQVHNREIIIYCIYYMFPIDISHLNRHLSWTCLKHCHYFHKQRNYMVSSRLVTPDEQVDCPRWTTGTAPVALCWKFMQASWRRLLDDDDENNKG